MLENLSLFYAFWTLILHCCDESTTLQVTSPVQTVVGWNASFSMQLDPYPSQDSIISIRKNGVIIMRVRGTISRDVSERFEFTGNTAENRISFILINVTLGDAGTYTATETGLTHGGEQKLIVKASPSKPQIIELTGSAVSGSDYRLNCSSMSTSVPPDHGLIMISEWKLNGQLITAGGRYKVQGTELTITSLTRQDNGAKLTCIAYEDSLVKSVPSNEHVIDVKYGPDNVQLNPSSGIIIGIENHSIIIRCIADCNPTCSFQWRRESVPGYLKTTQNLMIDNVGKSDADNYMCNVFNNITGRFQSLQTTLVTIYGPASGHIMLSTSQSSETVEDNTMLNITCSADCYPPCSFTWTGPQDFSQSGAQLSQVVDRNKGGNYICTASNQENIGKSATAIVTVTVMYGPGNSIYLGSKPPTIIVNLHQRAPDVTCSAICNPQCDYHWHHNRTLYSNGAILPFVIVENKTSGGNYTCEAYNKFLGLDRSSSASVNITVYYGAGIVSQSVQDSNTVNENSSAIFQCRVDSNPLPTITWRKEGTNTVLKTESGVVESQFRIESAQCLDTDNYTCSAYNGIWTQANETLQFFVKYVPDVPSNITITEVTKNSMTVQWVAGYNGGIQQTFHVVASAGDLTRNVTALDPGYSNIGTVMMKGLAASIKYSISMSASNLIGSSSVTEAIFVITLEELPSPVIRDFPVAAVAGGLIGAIVLVIAIVAVAFVLKRQTLKPKMKKKIEKVILDGKGPEYVNAAFRSDISTTEYEALQSDQTVASPYETLNDPKSKLSQSTDIRISSDPIPSTGAKFYDKLL